MLIGLVLIFLHLGIALGIDTRTIVSPLNALLFLVWVMVFRATELAVFGESIYPEWVRPYMTATVLLETSLLIGFFLICFFASYFSVQPSLLGQRHLPSYIYPETKQPRLLILAMAIVGSACAIQFFSQLTDVTDIILHKTSGEVFEGSGLMIAGISFLPAAILGSLMFCRTRIGLVLISLLLFLTTSAVYLPLGQRGNIFTFIVIAVVVCSIKLGNISLKWTVTIGALILFCLEMALIWRTTLRYGYEGELSDLFVVASTLDQVDRGEFDGLAGLVAYDSSIDFDSWWAFIEQLIPRGLMPSKKHYTAVSYLVNREITGDDEAGFTASILGTLYAQGGWIGIAVCGSILGVLMRLMQCWFIAQTRDPNGELMRGLAVVFVFFLVRNGDLTNVIIMLIANLAGISLLMAALCILPAWRRTWSISTS
jgi:oligosaccharide repeat unit polymerase